MAQKRRRTGRRHSADDRIKYMRLAAVPVILVVVLAVIILVMDKKPGKQEGTQEAAITSETDQGADGESMIQEETPEDSGQGADGEKSQIAPDNSQYTADFSQYELRKDEIPQVNQLISEYFQAKVDQNAEELFRIFGKTGDIGLEELREELQAEAVFIEDYVDIVCYTKPGLTEESYIAYVTYEAKFRRVDTLAPGLLWCYVVKAEDGSYIIREHVVGEEADYVAKQNQSEDVMLLSSQVNERLRQAIEEDTLLAGIYQSLKNGAVVPVSEEEEGGDSTVMIEEDPSEGSEGTGETVTETEAGTGAETEAETDSQTAETSQEEGSEAVKTSETAGDSSVKIEP